LFPFHISVVVTNTAAQPLTDETPGEQPVRGFLHPAAKLSGDGLMLTHGAGGNCNAPLLVAFSESFSAAGVTVLRCDLPFRQRRPHGPPSPASAKQDQEGVRRAVTLLRNVVGGRLFLSGQSYGGRQASMLAATEPDLVKGLLLLSYPLHPPGRPTQLRTAHFSTLRTPTLFVQGTKDPFGSIEEMESAVKLIPAQTKLLRVEGVGHSLLSKSNKEELVSAVVKEFLAFRAKEK
jgi:predicted alpha/beta-hydrolase family hydrolase